MPKDRHPEQDFELLSDAQTDDDSPQLAANIAADEIYEASRTICHRPPAEMTPFELYRMLGDLKGGYGFIASQALDHISTAAQSMPDRLRLTHDDGDDPNRAVLEASRLVARASAKAEELGDLLDAAQTAVGRVGYEKST